MFKRIKNYLINKFTKVVHKEVIIKCNHGLIQTDLERIKKVIDMSDYRVGDSLESVAYKQGQKDLIRFIETHLTRTR